MLRTLSLIAIWVVAAAPPLVARSVVAQEKPETPPSASETDASQNAELVTAKKRYLAEIRKAQEKLFAAIVDEDKSVTESVKLKPEDKLKRLDELAAELRAFESEGTLPKSPNLKKEIEFYQKEIKRAREVCEKAFDAAANKSLKVDRKAAQVIVDAKREFFAAGISPLKPAVTQPSPNVPSTPDSNDNQKVFTGHDGKVSAVRFASRTNSLITGGDSNYKKPAANGKGNVNYPGEDNTVRIWSIATGQQRSLIRDGLGQKTTWQVQGISLSPDGKQFAAATCRPTADYCMATVTVWTVDGPKQLHHFALTGRPGVWTPWFSRDGRTLYAVRGDSSVHTFNLASGKETSVTKLDPSAMERDLVCAGFSADRSLVFGGMKNGKVRVWSVSDGKPVREFTGHTGEVLSLAISSDDKLAATGSADGEARVWEVSTGKEITVCRHGGQVSAVAFASGYDRLVTGGGDKRVILWQIPDGKELKRFEGHTDAVLSLDVSSDGRVLASGSADKTARTWTLPDPVERKQEPH